MWITPNTSIKLLSNVPLDPTYDHTIWFSSAAEQRQYFTPYIKREYERNTYQRLNRGWLKIEEVADNLYDCNYMMFQNTAYGNKWFYAFVKTVEYVNDNVTQIEYEIDEMQTWHFDYQPAQCFVERETIAQDALYANLVPENIPTGEIMNDREDLVLWHEFGSNFGEELCIIAMAPFGKTGASQPGETMSNVYTGLHANIFCYNPNTYETMYDQLNAFLSNTTVAMKASQIVTMFYYFKDFAVQSGTVDQPISTYNQKYITVPKDNRGFKDDYNDANEPYYEPRNNKLYTAPYNYLTLTDWTGNSIDYAYEYFHDVVCPFLLRGGVSVTPAIFIAPCDYMGTGVDVMVHQQFTGTANFNHAFVFNNFPKIPWNTDSFVAWLAQTAITLGARVVGDFIGSGGMLASGLALAQNRDALVNNLSNIPANNLLDKAKELNPSGDYTHYATSRYTSMPSFSQAFPATTSMATNPYAVGSLFASGAQAAIRGREVQGNCSDLSAWGANLVKVSAVSRKIRKEWAKKIDQYFDRFGYQTNQIKVPNRHVRESWTYCKTNGCVLGISNLPADSARTICSIYDRGITFWDKDATVGDYTQSNNEL